MDNASNPLSNTEIRSPAAPVDSRGPAIPCLQSMELFGQAREILIEHGGGYYRLRLTQSNKLILTK
jgi:hemin uptake protein HemP